MDTYEKEIMDKTPYASVRGAEVKKRWKRKNKVINRRILDKRF